MLESLNEKGYTPDLELPSLKWLEDRFPGLQYKTAILSDLILKGQDPNEIGDYVIFISSFRRGANIDLQVNRQFTERWSLEDNFRNRLSLSFRGLLYRNSILGPILDEDTFNMRLVNTIRHNNVTLSLTFNPENEDRSIEADWSKYPVRKVGDIISMNPDSSEVTLLTIKRLIENSKVCEDLKGVV